jgi:hypothetical protein
MEPVGQLKDVWVQIKGVPPKWCDWGTIKEIASSLGKLGEVDWQTLFSSFLSIVRVKSFCKDPHMIPESRVMKMEDLLFMLHFKVENLEQMGLLQKTQRRKKRKRIRRIVMSTYCEMIQRVHMDMGARKRGQGRGQV